MGLFEFILILVALVVLVEAGTKLLQPLAGRLADLIGDVVDERRQLRRPDRGGSRGALPEATLEEIEDRLARIEDRLGFIEELKASPRRPALPNAFEDVDAGARR
jgi:hypothetical protein